jgi:pimeloyl-ACP methyl ester carboxylesterase
MSTILFLHGLNTYDDEMLRIGPLTYGSMHQHLQAAFEQHQIKFVAATDLGSGSPENQAHRALPLLTNDPTMVECHKSQDDLHIIGHSVGGLVARVLAQTDPLKSRIKSIITVGTPHAGTNAAYLGIEFAKKHPWMAKLMRASGYNIQAKGENFKYYTPEAMANFNERYPSNPLIREISCVCEVAANKSPWPFKVLQHYLHLSDCNDGLVTCDSQRRGVTYGPFELDHLAQTGFFFQQKSSEKEHAKCEFFRMIETIVTLVSKNTTAKSADQSGN